MPTRDGGSGAAIRLFAILLECGFQLPRKIGKRYTKSLAVVEEFDDIDAPLACLAFTNIGLRFAEPLSNFLLAESGCFARRE